MILSLIPGRVSGLSAHAHSAELRYDPAMVLTGWRPWRRLLFGLVAAIALLSCGGREDRPDVLDDGPRVPNPDVPNDRLPAPSAAFEETDCLVRVPGHVTQCGVVTLPLMPGEDAQVQLAVARVFTQSTEPRRDPVVYLDGGPGADSLSGVDWLHAAFVSMAPDRDFIFFDQRGVGLSRPNLQCTESGPDEIAIAACFERLSEQTNLNAFNSIQNARDVEGIRRAFGYDSWNLFGISYGTRLALTVLRDHPEGVRSAILDSVVPLQADLLGEVGRNGYQSFLRVVEACARDADCASAYPDPLGQLTSLVSQLDAEPVEVGGFPLDGETIVLVIFNLLYSPSVLAFVPLLIDTMAGGDFSLFEELEPTVSSSGISFGMHLSLHCSEEVPFSSEEAFAEFDAEVEPALRNGLSGRSYLSYCEDWPVEVAASSENEPALSDVPALILAGAFDPITPPKYAELVAEDLENSQYLLLESESHGASTGRCGRRLVRQFLDDFSAELDFSCLSSQPGIEFFARGDPGGQSPKLEFSTQPPTDAQLEELREELRRRLR